MEIMQEVYTLDMDMVWLLLEILLPDLINISEGEMSVKFQSNL